MAMIALPTGIAAMTPAGRGRLALEVVHTAAVKLGQARGWDAKALVESHDHAIAAGLRYRWDGAAKTSPDRRHVARPAYVIDDDGQARVIVEIRRREDGTVVSTSAPAVIWGGSFGLARHAATLRWRSRTRVELARSIVVEVSGPVSVRTDDGEQAQALTLPEYRDTTVELGIVTRTPADLGPRIEVIGGGPMNGVPAAYPQVLIDLLEQPELAAWWRGAGGAKVLEVRYDFAATTAGVSTRRTGDTVKATIRRPVSTFEPGRDHAALARDDFAALLAMVRLRRDS